MEEVFAGSFLRWSFKPCSQTQSTRRFSYYRRQACGLAKPNPLDPQAIVDLYVQHGGEIFKKSILDPVHYLYGPRYDSTALESHLASELGNVYLSAVENVRKRCFDPTFRRGPVMGERVDL